MHLERVAVELWPGAESLGYQLTSDEVSIVVADLGAHLASVVLRVGDDDELEITVPYPAAVTDGAGSHGASIGRYANRIAGAQFSLDGTVHTLDPNEGPNQIHGGPDGFGTHAWSASASVDGDTGRVVLRHKSKAGDMGFPGKVQATAVFALTGNQLQIEYSAKVGAPTPVNLTNHAYWNLGGHADLDDHELTVAADSYVAVDGANIPVPGPPLAVQDTRFDCRKPRSLEQITNEGGYDHCYVLESDADTHATLSHASGRRIDVRTNQVGLQVYTGQHLDPTARGIALETQALPDTPNRPDFGDCTVRPGDDYRATTTFTFHC